MGIGERQTRGWRRWGAFLCLCTLLFASVIHAAHFCPLQLSQDHARADTPSSSPGSVCLACIAIYSSVAEPLYCAASRMFVAHSYPAIAYESPLTPTRFFRLFVRPPPIV